MELKQHSHNRGIVTSYSQTVGHTPLLQLPVPHHEARLLLKLEQFNPMGNMKFRMALNMVNAAEASGQLKPGGRIVESTSGNTGLGLAAIAAERGYRFTAIVDSHAAKDKLRAMRALGADIVFVDEDSDDGELSTALRDETAARIAAEDPGSFWTEQHNNRANPDGYTALAEELLEILGPEINALVGAAGTGGSLCGTAKALRQTTPELYSLGVEPEGSIIFGGPGGSYYQSGTGTPPGAEIGTCVDYDQISLGVKVDDISAFNTARYIAQRFGLLLGGSAGGALYAAIRAIREKFLTGTIVVIIPDAGDKYLDSYYDDDWMTERNLLRSEISAELDLFFGKRNS
ncbi:PLP-dependent cysteine synthase family protein [Kiloniella laminariae]|uniref:PLP-dependent cysteine synthase family protein n=1 Tax=Kiloniella laminariae TaxID=454162 RepID=UPI0003684709|nr:cysteine synthase family protein [Kiloniella laminariae]